MPVLPQAATSKRASNGPRDRVRGVALLGCDGKRPWVEQPPRLRQPTGGRSTASGCSWVATRVRVSARRQAKMRTSGQSPLRDRASLTFRNGSSATFTTGPFAASRRRTRRCALPSPTLRFSRANGSRKRSRAPEASNANRRDSIRRCRWFRRPPRAAALLPRPPPVSHHPSPIREADSAPSTGPRATSWKLPQHLGAAWDPAGAPLVGFERQPRSPVLRHLFSPHRASSTRSIPCDLVRSWPSCGPRRRQVLSTR